jgi:hypothetical protein
MSSTTITIIIFAVICLSIMAIYISQARERARVEKARRTTLCVDRYQRMQQLLHDLPPQYLNNELRIMILERSIETLHELIQLNHDAKHEAYLQTDLDHLKQIREQNPKYQAIPVNSEAKAKEVRDNLEILHRFIESQHRNKRLTTAVAKKYLDFIKLSICQSKADLFVSRAQAAKEKPRLAIHNYHCAIDCYKPLGEQPQALKAIQQLRMKIKALETEAEQQNQQAKPQVDPVEQHKTEWDTFLQEDDTWKKKKDYDD